MQSFLQSLSTMNWWNGWVFTTFLIVLGTGAAQFFVKRFLSKLQPALEKTNNIWDDTLLRALGRPVTYLIWALGLSVASELVASHVHNTFVQQYVSQGRSIAIIATFVWFLIRYINEVQQALLNPQRGQKQLDKSTVHIISQMLRLAVLVTAVLITLQTLNVQISGLIAAGGISTIMISMAAKDWLGNFFGGLNVYMDRPFHVGDWIRSPDKKIEGTVEHIGWRTTMIRTFDKRPLYVPNGVFSTISVENPSRMSNRRIYTKVGLRYDDANKIASVIADIKTMLLNHPDIDTQQTLLVNLTEFGPYALNIMVYTFTKTTNWAAYLDVQQDVFLKILEIIEQHQAQCAFPTTTLDMPSELAQFEHLGQRSPEAGNDYSGVNEGAVSGKVT